MKPEVKFNSYVLLVTTALVFLLWVLLAKIAAEHAWISAILGGLISLGFYRVVTNGFLGALRYSLPLKKFLLGPSFMEGTWVGFFLGHESKVRYFVEFFEQDIGDLVIRGFMFDETGKLHGSWVAENALLNTKVGKLSYLYHSDASGNTFVNPGIAFFDMIRDSPEVPPKSLVGFSSDLYNPAKFKAFERKIADNNAIELEQALQKAKDVYEEHKAVM